MLNADTLETYTGGDTDATRQLVTQAFTNDVTISPSTTALEIAFKVTNMLSIENDYVSVIIFRHIWMGLRLRLMLIR